MSWVNGQEKKEAYAAESAGNIRMVVDGVGGPQGDMSPVTGPANKALALWAGCWGDPKTL